MKSHFLCSIGSGVREFWDLIVLGIEWMIQGSNSSLIGLIIIIYGDGADLYFQSERNFGLIMIFYIPVLGECWQFEFSHVLGELLCEARNVFLRALKKRGGEMDGESTTSFRLFRTFLSLLISLIFLT